MAGFANIADIRVREKMGPKNRRKIVGREFSILLGLNKQGWQAPDGSIVFAEFSFQ
jgi:hypothetical protein